MIHLTIMMFFFIYEYIFESNVLLTIIIRELSF